MPFTVLVSNRFTLVVTVFFIKNMHIENDSMADFAHSPSLVVTLPVTVYRNRWYSCLLLTTNAATHFSLSLSFYANE